MRNHAHLYLKNVPLPHVFRAERILCMALEYEGEASKPTCACWVGQRANCFAVGYDDGSVLLWGVPSQALQGEREQAGSQAVWGAFFGWQAAVRKPPKQQLLVHACAATLLASLLSLLLICGCLVPDCAAQTTHSRW